MRYLKYEQIEAPDGIPLHYVEIACLSSETKPVENITMGSAAIEVNTGDVYFFNETAGSWIKQ